MRRHKPARTWPRTTPTMQPNCGHLHSMAGSGDPCPAGDRDSSCQPSPGAVHIQLGEARESSRQGSQSRSHGHGEAAGPEDPGPDSEDPGGSSLSELRYLLQWLHKSLPYLLILCVKLLMQHLSGISLGIGLLTTYAYANKSIVNQVFLRERCSKLQCTWLLLYLSGSALLLYYTFHSQSLYYSLIFLNPTVDFMNFWEVLWIVGVTDFILKFLFMGFKCFILLVPSFIMSFKSKGYWYLLVEELCQYYRMFVPIPVWFRFLIAHGELDSGLGWTLGILLGLLYLILKRILCDAKQATRAHAGSLFTRELLCPKWNQSQDKFGFDHDQNFLMPWYLQHNPNTLANTIIMLLSFFGQLRNFRQVLRIFFTRPHYGVPASKRQCSESDDICPICQAEFQKPILLICQHTFCEECISLWFNREKTCPLCRTVISDHVNKWKDGATSMHLQIF